LSEDEFWNRRFRSVWPFGRRRMFGDFDDVFSEVEEFMSRSFRELSEKAPEDLVRERTLPGGGKVKEWGPFIYGYSMTVGPDGKSQIQEFGNVKPETWRGRPRLDVKEKREPLADVITTDREIKVIVELPGVAKKDIKLRGTKTSLSVSADTNQRKYFKKLELPEVNPKSAKSKYINGVLEVVLKKTVKEEKTEGEEIEIE
jgi:HSP20 family protein